MGILLSYSSQTESTFESGSSTAATNHLIHADANELESSSPFEEARYYLLRPLIEEGLLDNVNEIHHPDLRNALEVLDAEVETILSSKEVVRRAYIRNLWSIYTMEDPFVEGDSLFAANQPQRIADVFFGRSYLPCNPSGGFVSALRLDHSRAGVLWTNEHMWRGVWGRAELLQSPQGD